MTLALLVLTGCGGDLSPYMPTVKFQSLRVNDLDFEAIDVDFVFDVTNPNGVTVPVDRFTYALGFEGIDFLSGDDPDGMELTADATSELPLNVNLNFQDMYDAVQATRGQDYVGFQLAGGFGFDTSLGPVDIAYDEEGSFPAVRTPRIDLSQLRVPSFTGDTVEVALDLDVDNDHGSRLDFLNLDYAVGLAGEDVGGGEMEEVGAVEGASTKTLTIPLEVDVLSLGTALLSGDSLNVDLDADVEVDTPFGMLPLTIDERGNVDIAQE